MPGEGADQGCDGARGRGISGRVHAGKRRHRHVDGEALPIDIRRFRVDRANRRHLPPRRDGAPHASRGRDAGANTTAEGREDRDATCWGYAERVDRGLGGGGGGGRRRR